MGFGTLYTRAARPPVSAGWRTARGRRPAGDADRGGVPRGARQSGTADYDKVSGGFVISSPAIGLSALCSYQTADSEPAVHTVYPSAPRESRFALLPGRRT